MKYLLKSCYPCIVKTNSEFCELSTNDTLEIDNESCLFVYPQKANRISFMINLLSPVENKFFSLLKQNENTLIILEDQTKIKTTKKKILNFGDQSCELSISNNLISFETNQSKIEIETESKYEFIIEKIKSFACVYNKQEFYAFSIKKSRLTQIYGDNIELNNNILTIEKYFDDSLNRKRTATFKIDEDIQLEKEEFYRDTVAEQTELLPYRILESIKAKDFDFVYKHLNETLQSKIQKSQLGTFFGNINCFLPLSTKEFICISNKSKSYITFDLVDNKICDISMDEI